MAAKWVSCGGGFIEADVIRWTEAVWWKSRRKRSRAVKIGDRVVIAEVLRDEGGWLELLVRQCTVGKPKYNRPLVSLTKNMPVRRKRRTIERAQPERLLWSDEAARALLLSKFLGVERPPRGGASP